MAIKKEVWDKAKAYFEAGKSLTYISDTLNINKSNISRKANKDKWIKGKTQQLKADIIDLEQQKATISQQNATLTQQVATLEQYEITTLDELIQEETRLKSLIFNATVLNVVRVNETLTKNNKKEMTKVKTYSPDGKVDGEQIELFEMPLASQDFKNNQDTLDKASITLNLNQRHSNSQINIDNTNAQQNNTLTIDDLYKAN